MENSSLRKDLGNTKSNWDQIQLICFLGYIVLILLDEYFFRILKERLILPPIYLRIIIGIILLAFAVILAKKGISIMYSSVRNPPSIVDSGPFAYSRHPMYLSALLLYFSFFFMSFSILGVFYFLGVIFLYRSSAIYEEKALLLEYGEKYISYMKKTRRWIQIKS